MTVKTFDLNIEKILENWEIRHAVREIIANALDEQLLTNTQPVSIRKAGDDWIIRDYGRGIKYTHLTQNENQEKLNAQGVIGRFGIGLKDALATFERNGVKCHIQSRYGIITTSKMSKQGFGDVSTLHAVIEETNDNNFAGTAITLSHVADEEVRAAHKMFLSFSGDTVTDTTAYGQIVSNPSGAGKIYINGVLVAQEDNFLFSYNITHLNAQIKKAINRERTHVGRSAYTDTVKKILLSSTNVHVANLLAEDMSGFSAGSMHDELSWIDVQEHAVTLMNKTGDTVFITAAESMMHPDMVDDAHKNGLRIVTIPDSLRIRIIDKVDDEGKPINDITRYVQTYNDSYHFSFIDTAELTTAERYIYARKEKIIEIYSGILANVADIKISETLRPDIYSSAETLGCWDPETQSVVIARKCLSSLDIFAGVLIHELIHAKTGFSDVSRDFENALTDSIGALCAIILEDEKNHSQPLIHQMPNEAVKKTKPGYRPWYKFW